MSEIDNFEASLKLAGRRIGFPKMTLIENESFKKSWDNNFEMNHSIIIKNLK